MKQPTELANEIGEWGQKMFPVNQPDFGLIEEVGEATHGILKRMQKIRKMDQDDVFFPHMKDAFADVIIYLLHLTFLYKIPVSFTAWKSKQLENLSDRKFLAQCLKCMGTICDYAEIAEQGQPCNMMVVPVQRFTDAVMAWANKWGIDAYAEANHVWESHVSKRKWNENRESAHELVP